MFEALELGYLKSMIFAVYCNDPKTKEDALLETYQFQVELPKDGKSVIKVNGVPATRDSLKRQAVTFIRALVEFSGTLESLPEDRWLTLKLVVSTPVCSCKNQRCWNEKWKYILFSMGICLFYDA